MVPSSVPWFDWAPPPPGPATSLEVILPATTQAGVPSYVKVVALSASNLRAVGYTGTIHFTSSDSGATLPSDFTFAPSNFGAAYLKVTWATTGTQTLTATDTTTASITGSASTMVTPAPVATHFLVVAPTYAATGVPVKVYVTALDASNHRVPNYSGTVHFTSTDGAAVLPGDATLVSGVGKFTVTLNTTGTQVVSATDMNSSSITGSASIQVAQPGVAVRFVVFAEPFVKSGQSFTFFVAAFDATNHLATSYSGTVQFASSDSMASLPGVSTLNSGIGIFSATLATKGAQTITVSDVNNSSLKGTGRFCVSTGWWWV
jgi:hypothetical protein